MILLEHAILIAIICLGVKAASARGKILEPVKWFVEWLAFWIVTAPLLAVQGVCYLLKKDNEFDFSYLQERSIEYLKAPFFSCSVCMASVWTILYLIVFDFPIFNLQTLALMGLVAGLNHAFSNMVAYLVINKEMASNVLKRM